MNTVIRENSHSEKCQFEGAAGPLDDLVPEPGLIVHVAPVLDILVQCQDDMETGKDGDNQDPGLSWRLVI